ncbi:thymidylate kinase [Bombus impatiens]|uniref:Thymidylate kinase n=1 Tax=Bombus impatiens TaxID=132113 RepID=A0A6P3DYZ1_BOMIM|nr:thymidylate kinase [Bombus impatiens]
MSTVRGALVVLEGCDRAGKSTQAKLLVHALKQRDIPVEQRAFPDRTTATGEIINNYLSKKLNFSLETAHMLFSANRWECKDEILRSLYSGTTVVIDRYAGSGAAYTAATTGRCLDWCKAPDKGLPSPDVVIFLNVSKETQCSRSNWGDERYENNEIQSHVASNYRKIMDQTWYIINADDDKSKIHSQILQKILDVIDQVKDLPVSKLYESIGSEN